MTVLVCGAALFPILWGLSTSLKPANLILEYPPKLLPTSPTLEHYALLFSTGIHKYLLNSAIVSAFTVALCVLIGRARRLCARALRVPRQGARAVLRSSP